MKILRILLVIATLVFTATGRATVPSSTTWVQYTLTTNPQTLTVPFVFQNGSDLLVLDSKTSPPTTLTLNSDYSVSGGTGSTGTIATLAGGAHAVAVGDVVTISRKVPLTQTTTFINGGPITATMIGQALDKLTTIDQQLNLVGANSLQFQGDEVISGVIPLRLRKNAFLAFDANGLPWFPTTASIVTSVTAPLTTSSINALRSVPVLPLVTGASVQVLGYYALGDGGGGPVRYLSKGQPPATYVDNGGSVIVPTGGNGSAAWLWDYFGPINAKWFGSTGNGVTDDTATLKAAMVATNAASETLYIPAGQYLWTDTAYSFTTLGPVVWQGDGSAQVAGTEGTTILINADGKIFNVNCYIGFGSDVRRSFTVKNICFRLLNPGTNTNATAIYATNGINFGAQVYLEKCWFDGFTNCGVQIIRGSRCVIRETSFFGVSAGWGAINWGTTTRDDAGLRLWGADGTATTQDHSFCNMTEISGCAFSYTRYGIDGWGIYHATVSDSVGEFLWVPVINRGSDPTVHGMVSSTQRAGFGGGYVTLINHWFENVVQWNVSQTDLNLSTGADVNPTRRTYYLTLDCNQRDTAKDKTTSIGVIQTGTGAALMTQLPIPSAPAQSFVMDVDNSGNGRLLLFGPDAATNKGISITSVRSDGSNPLNFASMDSSGVVTLGNLFFRSNNSTPVGSLTPSYIGEEYLDTTAPKTWWKATGTTNVDWRPETMQYLTGAGSPVGSVTPLFVGQEYLRTVGPVWWKSTGLTNADWVALN